jgi:hypothetical protein
MHNKIRTQIQRKETNPYHYWAKTSSTCAAFHHIDGEGNNIADYFAKQCTDKDTEFLAML